MARTKKETRESATAVGVGHLRKQGRLYHFRWVDPETGQRQSRALKTGNQRVAIDRARALSTRIENGEEIEDLAARRKNRSRTFTEVAEEYFNFMSKGQWTAATATGNHSICKLLIDEFGDRSIGLFKPKDFDGYVQRRIDEGASPGTVNKALAYIRGMFAKAVDWGYLSVAPTQSVSTLKTEQLSPDALTEKQVERLLTELTGHWAYSPVLVALDTGLRWQELRRLTWGDVDWDFGDFGSIGVGNSKSKNFRVVPLTERLHLHLKERYEQSRENAKVLPLMKRLPVLPSPLDPSIPFFDVRRPLSEAGYKIGIGHIHLHQLRHTWATRLRDKEVPLDRIMELGGWRTYAMVQRYAKSRPTHLIKAIAALNG